MPTTNPQTEAPEVENLPPAEPPKRRRGPSRREPAALKAERDKATEREQAAKANKANAGKPMARGVPPRPLEGCDLAALNKWLEGITPEGWQQIGGPYLYREWPIINRKMVSPKNPKYIDVLPPGGPIEESLIRSRHGGGAYKILVAVRTGYGDQGVTVARFKIPDDECAPKVDPRELEVENPKNGPFVRELKAAGVLDPDGRPKDSAMQDTLERTMSKLVDSVLEKREGTSPAEIRDAIRAASAESGQPWKEVFQLFREQLNQRANSGGGDLLSIVRLMLTQQNSGVEVFMASMETQAQMFRDQMEFYRDQARGEPAPSETDQLTKLLDLQDRLAARANGNGNGNREPHWLEVVAPAATEIGKGLTQLAAAIWASKNGGSISMQPTDTPSSPHTAAAAAPASSSEPVKRPPPPPLPPGGYKNPIAPFIHNNHLLVLESLMSGENGALFCTRAADLIQRAGQDANKALGSLTFLGESKVLEALREVPIVWQNCGTSFTEARAAKWVSEFFSAAAARKG